jgi:hydrogenase small subunit
LADIEDEHVEHAKNIAEHLGLEDEMVPHVHEHMDELLTGDAPVIWVQGQNCTGCTITLMDGSNFAPRNLGLGKISLRYQPDLMNAEGQQAIDIIEKTEREDFGKYLVVLEGAVPTGDGEAFCTFGLSETNKELLGNPVPGDKSIFEWLVELIPGAEAVLAVGNCASFGGIPTMGSKLTGATSATDVVEAIDPDKPVINVAGCPPHPDWIIGTLVDLLLWVGDHKEAPILDDHLRLKKFYEGKVHDFCQRRKAFEAKDFLTDWNDCRSIEEEDRCLLKMGCKGPSTHADCPLRDWNDSTDWCVGQNSPCQGCTEPDFYDKLPHLK